MLMNQSFRAWAEVLGAGVLAILSCVLLIALGVPVSRANGVAQPYDLSVTKADSPDPVIAGRNLTYTVTADNLGPDAIPIKITDNLPSGTCFVSVFDTPSGGTCSDPGVGGNGAVSCTGRPPTASGGTYSAEIVAYVCPSVPKGSPSLSNTATADGACVGYLDSAGHLMYSLPCPDPNPGNNSPTEPTSVQTQSDLVVTQTVTPSTITTGSKVVYTINIENRGPSDSLGTRVTQMLSPGAIVLSVTGPATCSGFRTNELTCDFTSTIAAPVPVPNGNCCTQGPTSAELIVTVGVLGAALPGAALRGSVVTSTVTASSPLNSLPDVTPPNNTATDTVSVVAQVPVLGPLGLMACALIIFAVGVRLLPKRASRS